MSVKSCSRSGCNNIMCRTYVNSIGYICNECQDEFKEYLILKQIKANTEDEIIKALEKFMEIRRSDFKIDEIINVDDFFKNYTS